MTFLIGYLIGQLIGALFFLIFGRDKFTKAFGVVALTTSGTALIMFTILKLLGVM